MNAPTGDRAMLQRAYELIQASERDQAKAIVAQLLWLNRKDPDALYLAAYFAEQPDLKIKLLERVLAARPDHPQAKKILVQVQLPSLEAVLQTGSSTSSASPNTAAFDLDGLLQSI